LFVTTFCIGFLVVRFADARGGADVMRTMFGKPAEKVSAADLLNGNTELRGPGVTVVIDDVRRGPEDRGNPNRYLVHAQDLLMVRNELFAAGAEAVSINGERVVTTSAIRCVGPVVRVNDRGVVPPYKVSAIGDAQAMKTALMMMGSVVDLLAAMKMRVDVSVENSLDMPRYEGMTKPRYAKMAEERN
jgi:uncharacterized protein YlxW (UPF0749 family)